ncbi:hypothetical protein N9V60_06565 [Flavobacteriaceae bacterium]|nr:hypothetical protein [Flavobacteriaceae bacterium]
MSNGLYDFCLYVGSRNQPKSNEKYKEKTSYYNANYFSLLFDCNLLLL